MNSKQIKKRFTEASLRKSAAESKKQSGSATHQVILSPIENIF